MKTVEGLNVISAVSMSDIASVSSRPLSDRLLVRNYRYISFDVKYFFESGTIDQKCKVPTLQLVTKS